MSVLFSTYLDGWFPTIPATPMNSGPLGDSTIFPIKIPRGYATFLWWRVQKFRVYAEFSGTRNYLGTTGGGAPWAYTETYGGTLDYTLDLANPSDLVNMSGAFVSAASNIGVNEGYIFQKLLQCAINAPSHSFAWDFPPPSGAPTLPSNYTESNVATFYLFTPNGRQASIVQDGDMYWPSLAVSLPPCGTTTDSGSPTLAMPFKDTAGNTIGTFHLYGTPLDPGQTVSGYIQWAGNWPAT